MPLEIIETTLERIFNLTPTVRTFRLRFPPGRRFDFQPGQFAMVHVPGSDKVHKKPYSINSSPYERDVIDLCIKLVEGGFATNWFWKLPEGTKIQVAGPYGNFFLKEPIDYDPIMIATGTGLAPFRSMIRERFHHQTFPTNRQLTLIFGVRYEDEAFYAEEFRALEGQHANFRFIPTISRPKDWKGEVGYVQEKLKKFLPDPQGKQIYVCGLTPMINAVQETALGLGYTKSQIHFEKYA